MHGNEDAMIMVDDGDCSDSSHRSGDVMVDGPSESDTEMIDVGSDHELVDYAKHDVVVASSGKEARRLMGAEHAEEVAWWAHARLLAMVPECFTVAQDIRSHVSQASPLRPCFHMCGGHRIL